MIKRMPLQPLTYNPQVGLNFQLDTMNTERSG